MFFWGYTSSCSSRQKRKIGSNFFHHYLFLCWWFWLTNKIWSIVYLLCIDVLFRYFVYSGNWCHKFLLCLFFLISWLFWILGLSFIITSYFSLYLFLLNHYALKGLTYYYQTVTQRFYMYQYLDLQYPFQKVFYRSPVQV